MGLFFLLVVLLLLEFTQAAGSTPSVALDGCPQKCGNLTIPYPFGLLDGCSRSEGFLLTCNDTFNPPRLTLETTDLLQIQVTNISYDSLTISYTQIASLCPPDQGESSASFDLGDLPYTLSTTRNKLTVLGCNSVGIFSNQDGRYDSCVSFCGDISSIPGGVCNGEGCCQAQPKAGTRTLTTMIASGLVQLPSSGDSRVASLLKQGSGNGAGSSANGGNASRCSVAFVVQDGVYNFSSSDLVNFTRKEVPVELEWAVGAGTNCLDASKSAGFECVGGQLEETMRCVDSDDDTRRGYRCLCAKGYDGNPYLPNGCQGMADQTPSPELLALLRHWAATGQPIPRELAHYLPLAHGAPPRPSVSQGGGSSSRQRRSTPPPPENPPSVPADAPASDRYMCFIDDNFTFAHQSALAGEITRIFKAFAQLAEYRWTYMSPAEQEWIFDGVLRSFPPAPGCTKEFFRPAFVKLAERRISDAVYRACTAALKKLARPDPTALYTVADYVAIKAFPPTWCLPARWERWCDIWATDAQFLRRSTAGRTNRDKQGIRSTSGSKSHAQLRRELETKLDRPPTTQEWWKATHTRGDNEWSTEEGKQVYDRYEELYQEKYRDVPAAEHPADDKTLWRQVMRGRAVGESRKQALGGLPLSFDRESSSSSHYSRPTPTYPQSQPPSQESQSLQQTMTSVVQSLHTITTLLTENIRHAAPANRPRGNHPQVEESDSEDVELNLSSDSDAEYEEEEEIRERREAHERWQESRASRKGKEPAPSKKKSSVTQKVTGLFRKKKK